MEKDKNGLIIPSKEHKYVIGIDFGHGETSAAYCEIEWGVPTSQLSMKDAKDIELNGETTIVSAISETDEGNFSIGASILDDGILLKDFQIGFKKEPEDINGREEQLMIHYMAEVYKRIKQNSLFSDGNHVVYIAFPSGWKRNEKSRSIYREMALKAGLPLAELIPESRAAFIHINLMKDVRNYMNKGLVVFDLGSSTLDLTYMRLESDGKITKIDDGTPLGASVIEDCIMKDKVEPNQEACRLFQEYPIYKDEMLLKCRLEVKEEYYNRMKASNNFVSRKFDIDNFDERENVRDKYSDLKIRIKYTKGEIEELIKKEVSYQTRIKDFLSDFQSNQLGGAPIYYVFLTGGASRMDFIKDIVSEAWHLDVIYKESNPSLSVSRGIAETGRAQARTYEMIAELKKEKDRILGEQLVISNDVIRPLSDSIASELIGNLKSGINWFKWSNRDLSFNDLEKELRSRLCNNLNIGNRFSALFNEKMKHKLADVEKSVQEIVSNYTKRKVSLKNDFSISFTQSTYSIGSDMIASINKTVDEIIDAILSNWIDYVLYVLLVPWNIVKLPYEAGRFIYETFFESDEQRMKRESKERQREREELALKKAKKLTASQREKTVEILSKMVPEIRSNLESKVSSSLKGSAVLKNMIQEESTRILEDFINKSIEQARLLYV